MQSQELQPSQGAAIRPPKSDTDAPEPVTSSAILRQTKTSHSPLLCVFCSCGATIVKTLLAISAGILVLSLFFFRLHSESGPMEMERGKIAVQQAKSWTVESNSQPESPNYSTYSTRTKVICPDDYEYSWRNRTPDDVIRGQTIIHTHGVSYVENVDGKWDLRAPAGNFDLPKECGKGPALVQQTLGNAIIELPRRRAGKMVKAKLQTIDGVHCQEWSLDFGNEWPQIQGYTICIDVKTHLPRRLTFDYPGVTHDFTGWNATTVEPPSL